MTVRQFQNHILSWYRKNRRDLPFRAKVRWVKNKPLYPKRLILPKRYAREGLPPLTPYHILVSEIMLQQTQISRVLEKYPEFLTAYPDWETLAKTRTRALFSVWQGMGYWRRARYLRECAGIVQKNFKGILPNNPVILEKLPGIGPYTSRSIACFAYQHPEAFIETNIRRVFIYFFFPNKKKVTDKEILKIAQSALWPPNPREWHYALMDYGALVLGKKQELNRKSKHYARQSKFEGSFRSFRTAVVKFLLAEGPASMQKIKRHLHTIPHFKKANTSLKEVLGALERDETIVQKNRQWKLR